MVSPKGSLVALTTQKLTAEEKVVEKALGALMAQALACEARPAAGPQAGAPRPRHAADGRRCI